MIEIVFPAKPDRQTLDRLSEAVSQAPRQVLALRFSAPSEFARDHLPAYLSPEPEVRRWSDLARQLETREPGALAWVEQGLTGLWFELALCCRRRLLANARVQLSFPALRFGLLPALGGGQRLARLLPLADAVPILLNGIPLGAERAQRSGFAQVAPSPDFAAYTRAHSERLEFQPWDRSPTTALASSTAADRLQVLNAAFLKVRNQVPPEDAGPTALLQTLHEGLERTFEAAIKLEQSEFFRVRETASARNRLRLFVHATAKARAQGEPASAAAAEVSLPAVGVIGAGLMGTGIAYAAARAGCKVFLADQDPGALARSFERVAKLAENAPSPAPGTRDLPERIHCANDLQEMEAADVIIEAVFERMDVKAEVLGAASRVLRPAAILASNTTTLPIAKLAEFSGDPARFAGMHFFAPVHRMDLLEVIRGPQTSAQTIRQALRLAATLGKTPVVVNDGPGFFTSRVVMAYVQEALFLLDEGVAPPLIDNVARNAGMIIGPLAMSDLTSLDLLQDIYRSLAQEGRGAARDSDRTVAVLARFIGRGRLGKKTRAGIYDYDEQGTLLPWAGLRDLFPARATAVAPEEIRQRLLSIQSTEAIRAQKEGIISDPDLGDLAAVLGWNYPVCLGGPFGYVHSAGAEKFAATCRRFAAACGPRFELPP